MAESTKITWADSTFNPWIGCARVSPGCDHCYAAVSTPARTMGIAWGPRENRKRTSSGNWLLPIRWEAAHDRFASMHGGRRRRVFCASLSDVFDNAVDPAWRHELWALVRATPHLDWLILTKRIGNVRTMLPDDWWGGYQNVWLGITVVNQDEADRDIPKLLHTPSAVRWLSLEPLIARVDLCAAFGMWWNRTMGCFESYRQRFGEGDGKGSIDWVVVGGESGPCARTLEPAWIDSLQRQCAAASVPFFFKQWGGSAKNKGGCAIGGAEWKAWPLSGVQDELASGDQHLQGGGTAALDESSPIERTDKCSAR